MIRPLLGLLLISHQDRRRDAHRLFNIGFQQDPVNKSGTDETKSSPDGVRSDSTRPRDLIEKRCYETIDPQPRSLVQGDLSAVPSGFIDAERKFECGVAFFACNERFTSGFNRFAKVEELSLDRFQ